MQEGIMILLPLKEDVMTQRQEVIWHVSMIPYHLSTTSRFSRIFLSLNIHKAHHHSLALSSIGLGDVSNAVQAYTIPTNPVTVRHNHCSGFFFLCAPKAVFMIYCHSSSLNPLVIR